MVDDRDLTTRQKVILRMVVEEYVASNTPVGSKHLARRDGMEYGASTVRAELARLEQLDLLDQPHTSAGRVPTDAGYRYYVDHLVPRGESTAARELVQQALEVWEIRRELDLAMRSTAEAIAQVTDMLGVVSAPPAESTTIRRVEVLLLQPQLVMVVVITSTGDVDKRMFAFDAPVDPMLADWASDFLNEQIGGMSPGARSMAARLADPSLGPRELAFIRTIGPAVTELGGDEDTVIFIGGQSRFVQLHRAQDVLEMGAIMHALEERYALLQLLRGTLSGPEVLLRIGSEVAVPDLRGVSVVAAGYGSARRHLGAVSVIGPTRMDYRLAIATVREAARALSAHVEEVYE